jgi:hypothetical protein
MSTQLSTTGNERIVPGGNMPPAEPTAFDLVNAEIRDLYDEVANWADGEPIATQEFHDEVERLYDMMSAAGKRAEELRVAEVKPLDEAKADIQARYHPLIGNTKSGKGLVVIAREALNAMLVAWRLKVKAEKEAAAEKARQEAIELQAEAYIKMQTSSGNLAAREEAEEALSLAAEAAAFAKRRERDAVTGNGLRTSFAPELTDLDLAIKHYWRKDRAAFERLVTDLARQDVIGGARAIPGFVIKEHAKAL